MSSSSSIETTSDAQLAELEMARGVRGIAQEVNLDSSHDNLSDVNNTLEKNSEAFTRQYQNATAERRPAIVDVSVVGVDTEATAISSEATGEVFNSSSRSHGEVGHFVLRLDEDFDGEVTIVANEDEDEVRIEGNSDFSITDVNDESCPVTPTEGTVVFDFSTGTIFGIEDEDHDCEIKLINPNESYESLHIDSDEEVDYELVARGGDPLGGGASGHPAAWTVDLEYTYDTSELSVDREFEVEVYGDRR
ncbi:hypothetical protein OB955_03410 [Halobacteria archaeon AArc-m2/3/4]|uniref:Uncharacterized protein n=2 Tax=Natronoglomus mannanivorans TaxID=2979990 RepID=A0ABT2QA45_9EURY|nr:hypothetical protein [Halobacteria archaeon AArc-m2/3/4]